jgi:hypothetical protein
MGAERDGEASRERSRLLLGEALAKEDIRAPRITHGLNGEPGVGQPR